MSLNKVYPTKPPKTGVGYKVFRIDCEGWNDIVGQYHGAWKWRHRREWLNEKDFRGPSKGEYIYDDDGHVKYKTGWHIYKSKTCAEKNCDENRHEVVHQVKYRKAFAHGRGGWRPGGTMIVAKEIYIYNGVPRTKKEKETIYIVVNYAKTDERRIVYEIKDYGKILKKAIKHLDTIKRFPHKKEMQKMMCSIIENGERIRVCERECFEEGSTEK